MHASEETKISENTIKTLKNTVRVLEETVKLRDQWIFQTNNWTKKPKDTRKTQEKQIIDNFNKQKEKTISEKEEKKTNLNEVPL